MDKDTNQQQTGEQTCDKCAMPKSEWRGNNGEGYEETGGEAHGGDLRGGERR